MLQRNRSSSLASVLVAAVMASTVVLVTAGPAQAAVIDVRGSAYGAQASVGFFGGPPMTAGPAPLATLPAGGSAAPVTADAATGLVEFPPATLFSSGPITVSTQGTPAGGTITASADITSINTSGDDKFTAASASSSCTATEANRSGTATITSGTVMVSEGTSVEGDETYVAVPANPAPNTVIHGVLESVGDSFDYVFNEQVLDSDGSFTVSVAHLRLLGPTAVGDLYIGRSICGVNPGGRYVPLTPARILDTRDGTGGILGAIGPGAAIYPQVTGRGGVPASGVSAVVMNVTVTQPSAPGFLTLFPAGTALPLASNLGFVPGQTVPNLVVVKVGTNGQVGVYNSAGTTHVILDVAGWYADSAGSGDGRYRPLVPARILDTRFGIGGGVRLGAGESLELQVTGQGGVPASGVAAAVLNIVATQTTATSFLTAYPTGSPRPEVSNLNFDGGETVANRAMVKLGTAGRVTIYNLAGGTDVVVDVGGWHTDGSAASTGGTFASLNPARILDTRNGTGGITGPRPTATAVDVQITGRGGVPATGVSAVILNVTVTQPAAAGFVTLFPAGGGLPLSSDLNFDAGETRPNLAVVAVGAGGKVTLYVSAQTHVIFDVAGWAS